MRAESFKLVPRKKIFGMFALCVACIGLTTSGNDPSYAHTTLGEIPDQLASGEAANATQDTANSSSNPNVDSFETKTQEQATSGSQGDPNNRATDSASTNNPNGPSDSQTNGTSTLGSSIASPNNNSAVPSTATGQTAQSATQTTSAPSQSNNQPTTTVAVTQPPTTQPPTTPAPAPSYSVTAMEREILNLINEFRSSPNGRLKRVKPLPSECSSTAGLSPLILNNAASVELSRDWSQKMAAANVMSHRASSEQRTILERIGASFYTWGENVAWQKGYRTASGGDAAVALVFFEGWRESDSHFCNMVNPRFTHTGIGHHYDPNSGRDWATQNFYG